MQSWGTEGQRPGSHAAYSLKGTLRPTATPRSHTLDDVDDDDWLDMTHALALSIAVIMNMTNCDTAQKKRCQAEEGVKHTYWTTESSKIQPFKSSFYSSVVSQITILSSSSL